MRSRLPSAKNRFSGHLPSIGRHQTPKLGGFRKLCLALGTKGRLGQLTSCDNVTEHPNIVFGRMKHAVGGGISYPAPLTIQCGSVNARKMP